jgi:hypothetical protein
MYRIPPQKTIFLSQKPSIYNVMCLSVRLLVRWLNVSHVNAKWTFEARAWAAKALPRPAKGIGSAHDIFPFHSAGCGVASSLPGRANTHARIHTHHDLMSKRTAGCGTYSFSVPARLTHFSLCSHDGTDGQYL